MRGMLRGLTATTQLYRVAQSAAERVVAAVVGVVAAALADTEGLAGSAKLQQRQFELSNRHPAASFGAQGMPTESQGVLPPSSSSRNHSPWMYTGVSGAGSKLYSSQPV